MRNINFEDLFDWQLESDRHYMFLLEKHKQDEYEWEEQERNKCLPAIITVEKPILKDEVICHTRTIRRAHQKKL